jgi:hypothetical protein
MSIKKYSDFDHSNVTSQPEIKSNVEIKIEVANDTNSIKEEVLLAPKNMDNLNIEILEENIIKFNSGVLKDILETIKTKYSDTDYYIRKKDNELHIVKYNENLKLNINEFVNSLLKFYSSNANSKKIIEGIKVKGNQNFTIVENMKPQFSSRFVDDITKLLAKKKEN